MILVALFVAPLLALAILINPLIAILTVLATFPIGSVAQSIGPLRIQAVEAAVFVAALVVILRRLATGRIPLPFAAPLGWAVALFMWTLISVYSAIDHTLALKVLFSLLGGIVCATVVLAGCRDMRDLRILLGRIRDRGRRDRPDHVLGDERPEQRDHRVRRRGDRQRPAGGRFRQPEPAWLAHGAHGARVHGARLRADGRCVGAFSQGAP